MRLEFFSPLMPQVQDIYFDGFFQQIGNIFLYKLKETVYDDSNKPIGMKYSRSDWNWTEAHSFSKLCASWWVPSTEEKINSLS